MRCGGARPADLSPPLMSATILPSAPTELVWLADVTIRGGQEFGFVHSPGGARTCIGVTAGRRSPVHCSCCRTCIICTGHKRVLTVHPKMGKFEKSAGCADSHWGLRTAKLRDGAAFAAFDAALNSLRGVLPLSRAQVPPMTSARERRGSATRCASAS